MEGTHAVGRQPFMPDSTLSRRSAALHARLAKYPSGNHKIIPRIKFEKREDSRRRQIITVNLYSGSQPLKLDFIADLLGCGRSRPNLESGSAATSLTAGC